jgi:hypothetical protein
MKICNTRNYRLLNYPSNTVSVRFQFLTAASMNIAVFWVVVALMMEAASTVNFYQTTRRSNPEDSHLLGTICFAHRWPSSGL